MLFDERTNRGYRKSYCKNSEDPTRLVDIAKAVKNRVSVEFFLFDKRHM